MGNPVALSGRMRLSACCLLVAVFTSALFLPLDAAAQDDPPALTRRCLRTSSSKAEIPPIDRLPLKDTRVDVAIAGVIADVTVRQVYENRGTRPIHARYIFPASTRAAVYGMTMTVGDVRIVARIKEREQATRNSKPQSARARTRRCWSRAAPTCSR